MESITPKLFLKNGNKLVEIALEHCRPLMDAYKDGRGVSEMPKPDINLYNDNGKLIGEISYNGRVWLIQGKERIEVPQKGIPTAKELFSASRR